MVGRRKRLVSSNEVPRLLELLDKSGFEIIQSNGQRRYGPPPSSDVPTPAKGSEVFVGKLPRDCFEDELVPFMEKVGKVYEMRLMMDFSGYNRGFAFVTYHSPGDASRATIELNGTEIRRDRIVGVVKSGDNCRLFVGGLPKLKNKEEIMCELSKFVEGITEIILYSGIVDKAENRGFAFVEFNCHREAAVARRKLLSGKHKIWGRSVAVDWAEPEVEVDEEVMSKVKILYVRNIMISTPEVLIKETFEEVGEVYVERVKKIRDFAFVHFSTREDAEKALNAMKGIALDGADIEISWAKPVDKFEYQIRKEFTRRAHWNKQAKRFGGIPLYPDPSMPMPYFVPYGDPNMYQNNNVPDSAGAHAHFGRQIQVPLLVNSMDIPMPVNMQIPLPTHIMNVSCSTESASSYSVASSQGNGQCEEPSFLGISAVTQSVLVIPTPLPPVHSGVTVAFIGPPTGYFIASPTALPQVACPDDCCSVSDSASDSSD